MTAILGLDIGEKRVGVAVSDESGMIASPLQTLAFIGRKQLLRDLQPILQEYKIQKIIVGFPLTMKGEVSIAAQKIQDHVGWFRGHSDQSWELWDERLTTAEAERVLIEADLSRQKRRQVIDRVAAQRILQSYLDCNRSEGNGCD